MPWQPICSSVISESHNEDVTCRIISFTLWSEKQFILLWCNDIDIDKNKKNKKHTVLKRWINIHRIHSYDCNTVMSLLKPLL